MLRGPSNGGLDGVGWRCPIETGGFDASIVPAVELLEFSRERLMPVVDSLIDSVVSVLIFLSFPSLPF